MFLCGIEFLASSLLSATQVQNMEVKSASKNKQITNLTITPDRRAPDERFPVVYLLHGYGMTPAEWLKVQSQLPRMADDLRMIIVCPDGGSNWYVDSPVDPHSKSETYVTKELVDQVDGSLPIIRDCRARALCGLSMGGYGALRLAIMHQDLFSVAWSMSGLVDFTSFPNRWGTQDIFGKAEDNAERMKEYNVINLAHLIRSGLDIMIDCGTEDFFH